MKFLPPLRLLSGLVLSSTLVAPVFAAGDNSAGATPSSHDSGAQGFRFEIAGGVIVDHLASGKPMPATLNNVVGIARNFYPDEMISQIGVGDVPIGDILMESRLIPSSGAFFAALAMASQGRFVCDTPAGSVLLSTPHHPGAEPRVVNVFNLTRYLNPPNGMEDNLKMLEDRRTVMGRRLNANSQEMVGLSDEIEVEKARVAAGKHSQEDLKQMLDRLRGTVAEVLLTVDPKAAPPEISFNQGTNLLIVFGNPESVDAASKVISAINYP